MKRIVVAAALMARLVCAQEQTGAPKEIIVAEENRKVVPDDKDKELRERAAKFWDGFVTAKFRSSDVYVSDDAKEEYFSWPKKKIRGYKIDRVFYTKDGEIAKVLTYADTTLSMLGYGTMDIQQPVETWWRRENGSWFWFLPKSLLRDTPFGKMELNPQTGEMAPAAGNTAMLNRPTWKELIDKVSVSPQEVVFELGKAGKAEVEVLNGLPGVVSFSIENPHGTDELKVQVANYNIPKEAKGKVAIVYTPDPQHKEGAVYVMGIGVAQTGRTFPVKIIIKGKESK
jgi:hypothetical protein